VTVGEHGWMDDAEGVEGGRKRWTSSWRVS
jgi:hypothetical protein